MCELSFCEKLYTIQTILPLIGLTGSRDHKARAFGVPVGKRIILDYFTPGIDSEDLGKLAVIDKISEPVNCNENNQQEDQYQKSSSDDHHASLGIELLIDTLLGRITDYYVYSADISSLRPVAVFFDLALNIGLESVRKALEKSYCRTVRTAKEIKHDTTYAVACRRSYIIVFLIHSHNNYLRAIIALFVRCKKS